MSDPSLVFSGMAIALLAIKRLMAAIRPRNLTLRLVLAVVFLFLFCSVLFFGLGFFIKAVMDERRAYDQWCKERAATVTRVGNRFYCYDKTTHRTFEAPDSPALLQKQSN